MLLTMMTIILIGMSICRINNRIVWFIGNMDYLLLRRVFQSMLDCLLVHVADDMDVHTYLAVTSSPIGVRANRVSVEGWSLRLCHGRRGWDAPSNDHIGEHFIAYYCDVPYCTLLICPFGMSFDIIVLIH